ncbi:MAG: O-antigen ligase C-terminal domain-containing protein [Burkholderiaceae bacterium]|nr:O-antigen ligase C-terminal domain-containing protein [Burkholderiaceae bacterium]
MSFARDTPLLLLLGLGLLALGWLMPGHYLPWSTFQQQWMAGFGGTLIAASVFVPQGKAVQFRWPWLSRIALLFAGVPWVQLLAGQLAFLSDALVPSLFLLSFALSMAVGAALDERHGKRWHNALMVSIMLGAAISVALALMQWLRISDSIYIVGLPLSGRAYGNLAQPNHLVTLLAMGVAATLRAFEERQLSGATTAVLVAWFGLGMLTTQSRTAWMFVFLLAIWWLSMRHRAVLRLPGVWVATGVVAFAFGVLVWPYLTNALQLAPAGLEERVAAAGRLTIWQIMCDAIGRAPWFGYGWNQVMLAQQAAALDNPTQGEMFENSHNFVLDVFAWVGIPLGLVIVLGIAAWLVKAIRACRDGSTWAVLAAIGAVWAHAMLEFPVDYLYFVVPLGLMMGTIDAQRSQPQGQSNPSLRASASAMGALTAVLTGFLFWTGVEYMQVEDSVRQQRFVMARIGTDKVKSVPPPNVLLIDVPREYHRFWSTPVTAGMDTATLDWMRSVTRRTAAPPAMLRYALAAGLNGRADESARTLALICKMHQPVRCKEGQDSWRAAQQQHPQLKSISFP